LEGPLVEGEPVGPVVAGKKVAGDPEGRGGKFAVCP
jgi:hypothetical protein